MESLHVTVPTQMKLFVKKKVKNGMFGTDSDYVRSLIREDMRKGMVELEKLLLAGLEGEFTVDTPETRTAFRKELSAFIKKRKKGKTAIT